MLRCEPGLVPGEPRTTQPHRRLASEGSAYGAASRRGGWARRAPSGGAAVPHAIWYKTVSARHWGVAMSVVVLIVAIILTAIVAFQIAARSGALGPRMPELAARYSHLGGNIALAVILWALWLYLRA